jgi:hypothetical protein
MPSLPAARRQAVLTLPPALTNPISRFLTSPSCRAQVLLANHVKHRLVCRTTPTPSRTELPMPASPYLFDDRPASHALAAEPRVAPPCLTLPVLIHLTMPHADIRTRPLLPTLPDLSMPRHTRSRHVSHNFLYRPSPFIPSLSCRTPPYQASPVPATRTSPAVPR